MGSDSAIVLRTRDTDKGYDRGSSPFVPISARYGYRAGPPGKEWGKPMEYHATFPPVPATVAQARTAIDRALGPALPAPVANDLRLIVSELITNVVRHAALDPGQEI